MRPRRDNGDRPRDAVLTQDFESCVHFFLQPHRWDNVLHVFTLGIHGPMILDVTLDGGLGH
jgi:hypothetical protein